MAWEPEGEGPSERAYLARRQAAEARAAEPSRPQPWFVGIDPGASGALAALDAAGNLVLLRDMPVIEPPAPKRPRKLAAKPKRKAKAKRPRIDPGALLELFRGIPAGSLVTVEAVNAMPAGRDPEAERQARRGVFATLGLARCAGLLQGMALACGLEFREVTVQTWRRGVFPGEVFPEPDDRHERARGWALELWPEFGPELQFKYHHNRAEAAAIAWWTRERWRTGERAGEPVQEGMPWAE